MVAFLLAGEMTAAFFQFYFLQGFWPIMNNSVSAALYCFVWLYFSVAGAGPWSLDAKWGEVTKTKTFSSGVVILCYQSEKRNLND